METFEMTINYAGAPVSIRISHEENFLGTIYPVEMEGNYAFTIYFNEEEEWSVMREADGTTPAIENELFIKIIKNLQLQLRYAA